MKKLATILLLILSFCAVEAQDILYFPHDSTWTDVNDGKKSRIDFVSYTDIEYVLVDGMYVYLSILDTRRTDLKKLLGSFTSSTTIQTDVSTGYRFFKNTMKGWYSKPFSTYVLIGSDFFLVVNNFYGADGNLHLDGAVNDFTAKSSMEDGRKGRIGIKGERETYQYKYLDGGIAAITASSYLTETLGGKTLDYRPEYMMNRICKAADGWEFYPEFDNFMRCWAEGVPGDGIGEWLKVDFTRASDEMMILNGYIDFGNMLAYKKNNRLKRIRIDSADPAFSMEYPFEDYVAYHTIKMPAATKSVKITILDVYNGAKYSDTCVTAITLPQERWRPKEAEELEVRAYLESLGVLDYVKKYKNERE